MDSLGIPGLLVPCPTAEEILAESPEKVAGEYSMYDGAPAPRITAPPRGYKPFYISHIGRHGARYALDEEVYEHILGLLNDAHETGVLTVDGEGLRDRYIEIYPLVEHRGGDLSLIGQEQQRFIARTMYSCFPEVFRGKTYAVATSTHILRSVMSMQAFMDELRVLDRSFDFSADAGVRYLQVLNPNTSKNPKRVRTVVPPEALEMAKEFQRSQFDFEDFCKRYFTSVSFVEEHYGNAGEFAFAMRNIVLAFAGIGQGLGIGEVFTEEEMLGLWKVHNYNGYLVMGRSPQGGGLSCMTLYTVLEDILASTERDIEQGDVQLRLRFSHDTAVLPLVSLLRVNNFGVELSDPSLVADYWPSHLIPMACNLQIIVYHKGHSSSEMLVKLLYDGSEGTLPLEEVCEGFYSWDDFRAYSLSVIDEARERLGVN